MCCVGLNDSASERASDSCVSFNVCSLTQDEQLSLPSSPTPVSPSSPLVAEEIATSHHWLVWGEGMLRATGIQKTQEREPEGRTLGQVHEHVIRSTSDA